jgi:hypothetical protein
MLEKSKFCFNFWFIFKVEYWWVILGQTEEDRLLWVVQRNVDLPGKQLG